jgi:hypothetical protein
MSPLTFPSSSNTSAKLVGIQNTTTEFLLLAKAHVFVHPSSKARDHIPGYLGIAQVAADGSGPANSLASGSLVVRAEVIVEMGVVDRGGDDLDEIVRLLTWRSVGVREG